MAAPSFGAKDAGFGQGMPFYNATGLLRTAHATGRDFIFVTGNYRLGAFGWLAGPTMEEHATPNAGLYDQRLLFDFVKMHIGKFGGDAGHISAWGESAGAASILHHLTATEPPVFNRVMVQSPAYLWEFDRSSTGYAGRIFRNLSEIAGCPDHGESALECLRSLDVKSLQEANKAVIREEWFDSGLFAFNPAVDGTLIKELPTTAFRQGKFWKNITSLIVSHVYDESKQFVPCWISGKQSVDRYLNGFIPVDKYPEQVAAIKKQYSWWAWKPQSTIHDIIQDSSFICNTRAIFDAYKDVSPVYMMQYDFLQVLGAAQHATDLLPTFFNTDVNQTEFVAFLANASNSWTIEAQQFFYRLQALAPEFQPYLASFAATGVPEPGATRPQAWSPASLNARGEVTDVLQVGLGILGDFTNTTTDAQNTEKICGFWANMSDWLTQAAPAPGPGFSYQRPDL